MSTLLYFDSTLKYLNIAFLSYDYTKNYTAILNVINITTIQSNHNVQQRTASFNSINGTNNTFLFFSQNSLTRFTNNFTSSSSINANSSQLIIDAFFLTN
jgi:hypothetical protein